MLDVLYPRLDSNSVVCISQALFEKLLEARMVEIERQEQAEYDAALAADADATKSGKKRTWTQEEHEAKDVSSLPSIPYKLHHLHLNSFIFAEGAGSLHEEVGKGAVRERRVGSDGERSEEMG